MDKAKSTQLVMQIIYIVCIYFIGRFRRFPLGVANFEANLIYSVKGIKKITTFEFSKEIVYSLLGVWAETRIFDAQNSVFDVSRIANDHEQ